MEKIIWVVEGKRENLIDIQRKINAQGGMKAMCILNVDVLKRIIEERVDSVDEMQSRPSLIVIDYDMVRDNGEMLTTLKLHQKLAGVPLFFTVDNKDEMVEDECYFKGAMVVLEKPVNQSGIIRIERASWQYEVAKNYERILQKQASELETAKEIRKLNLQLESRNEFLHRVFGKYFSDEILEVILARNEDELIGGEKREIAVLMSDLRGFTSITEKMSAEAMTDLLNYYFGTMVDIISKYGGTVIEYMGDGVLSVFGAPIKSENYRANAIAAAIDMQNSMKRVNSYCEQMGYEKLKMGIGVHCGEGFVGNVGSEKMMRYNVLGSVVNICSRIEGCCIGGQVLASEELVKSIAEDVHVSDSMQIFAKGLTGTLNICSVTGIDGKYCCRLEKGKKYNSYIVENDVDIELCFIKNKLVEEEGIVVKVKEISKEVLKVDIGNISDFPRDVQVYGDVEIKIKGIGGKSDFSGGYAKITAINDKCMILNLTRTTKEFDEFYDDIENGLAEGYSVWRRDMEYRTIKLEEVELKDLEDKEIFAKKYDDEYVLAWANDTDDIKVAFFSTNDYIRALEFIDYLACEYGVAKGDKEFATTVISKMFIKVMMADMEVDNFQELFGKIIENYYSKCQWIFANDYAIEEKENIINMQEYIKKPIPWAYVKTTDIIKVGEKFKLKSLENESNMIFEAADDLYIMIGCRGEIYNISKEKFQATYDLTDEKFDIYTQMPDYIPEIQLYEDKTFVSLDDKAYLCYPKNKTSIYASELATRTKVFSNHNKGEYYVGRKGDYLAVRKDDLTDVYIIQREIFAMTYEKVK